MKKGKWYKDWHNILLVVLIVAYFIIFSCYSIQRYNAYGAGAYDMGAYMQVLWNAGHGNGLVSNIEFTHHFGEYFEPILFVFVPLYKLFEGPFLLFILQSGLIALGAIPLYLLAVMKLKNKIAGLVFAAAYLLYPSLQYVTLFDFHPVALAIPFLLFMVYFLEKKNYKLYFVFMLLSLSCRDDVALVVLFFSLYLIFVRKMRTIGVATLVISIIWFVIAFSVIRPAFGGTVVTLDDRYETFGTTFGEIVYSAITKPGLTFSTIFTAEKIRYMLNLLSPAMFLPLLSPAVLLVTVPSLMQNLLSSKVHTFSSQFHYDSLIIPFLFIAAVYGLHNLMLFLSKKKELKKNIKTILAIILVALLLKSVLAFYVSSPIGPNASLKNKFIVTEHHRIGNEILEDIPEDASILTTTSIMPHVAHRKDAFIFNRGAEGQYVLFDITKPFPYSDEQLKQKIISYVRQDDYGVVLVRDGYVMFRKGVADDDNVLDKLNKGGFS